MNEKKKRYDWCASYTCSSMLRSNRCSIVFLEEDYKNRISIFHLLEGN